MTVVVVGSVRFPAEAVAGVRAQLQAFVMATRLHDGCLAFDVAEDLFEPGLIRFSELWPDEGSLLAHLQAPHLAPWRAASAAAGGSERRFTAFDGANARPV